MILSENSADMYLAFGFLGGKEVKEAGIANAGLYDRKSCNRFLSWLSIILLTRQNGSPSTGYKSTSLSLEAIPGRSQCETRHYLLTHFAQHLMLQAGEKALEAYRSGFSYFSIMGIRVVCSLAV